MLYTMNTFEFSNTWSLTYLRPTIPPSFWDAIRQVELCWAFPGHWLPSKDPVKTVYWYGRHSSTYRAANLYVKECKGC